MNKNEKELKYFITELLYFLIITLHFINTNYFYLRHIK